MAGPLDGIDLTNPCLVWPRLQEAYYRLMAGERDVRSKFATQAGAQEEVEFASVSPDALLALVTRLKAECERRSGRRTNFAMTGRFRPRNY